jgi:hypothetical protein
MSVLKKWQLRRFDETTCRNDDVSSSSVVAGHRDVCHGWVADRPSQRPAVSSSAGLRALRVLARGVSSVDGTLAPTAAQPDVLPPLDAPHRSPPRCEQARVGIASSVRRPRRASAYVEFVLPHGAAHPAVGS